jgi:RimJ/RimL family protein N-acetyltransferase
MPDRPRATLRGQHVFLRPAERSDIPTFVRWFADADVTRNLMARAPFSQAAEEQWFDRMLAAHAKTDWFFVICLLDDERAIGTIGLHDLDQTNGTAVFGIAIGEKAEWDKGYGTDALHAICDFGFGELRLERIELEVYADNARARRSYEKAGFTLEGTRRRAHFRRGGYEDVHFMALLREEWAVQSRPRSWELD